MKCEFHLLHANIEQRVPTKQLPSKKSTLHQLFNLKAGLKTKKNIQEIHRDRRWRGNTKKEGYIMIEPDGADALVDQVASESYKIVTVRESSLYLYKPTQCFGPDSNDEISWW